MASLVQFIYSCHFPLKQTQTCSYRMDKNELGNNRLYAGALTGHSYTLFTSVFIFYSFQISVCCFLDRHTHTHTQAHAALWFSGVRGCAISSKTKGFFFFFGQSYISVLILIRDLMPISTPSPTPYGYTHTHARCVRTHTSVWIQTTYPKNVPIRSLLWLIFTPPTELLHTLPLV